MASSLDSDHRAASEELFAAYVEERERGRAPGFEELCRAHPRNADDLRQLHSDWARIEALRTRADLGSIPGGKETDALICRLSREAVQDPNVALQRKTSSPGPLGKAPTLGGLSRIRGWFGRLLRRQRGGPMG